MSDGGERMEDERYEVQDEKEAKQLFVALRTPIFDRAQ